MREVIVEWHLAPWITRNQDVKPAIGTDHAQNLIIRGNRKAVSYLASLQTLLFRVTRKNMVTHLTVVVVEEDRDRAIAIVDALKESADCEVFVVGNFSGLARKIAAHAPDIVLIDVDNPTRDMMEELTLASGPLERPVAMFVSSAAGDLAQTAVEAGVSAYVVDGLSPARIKPVIDTAIARFRMLRQMRTELAETRRALEERKVIDRAKGLLMKAKGIDEDAAYALLRKTAMDQGRRVADVAEALVTATALLG